MSDFRKLFGLDEVDPVEAVMKRVKAKEAAEQAFAEEPKELTMVYDDFKGEWVKASSEGMRAAQDAQQIAGIKGRFAHLNIEWTPEIEQEARRRDGGGITVYLETVEQEQLKAREEARRAVPGYGAWQ